MPLFVVMLIASMSLDPVLLPLSSIGIEVCMQQVFSKVEQSFDCFSCCKIHQKHSIGMLEHAILLLQHHYSNRWNFTWCCFIVCNWCACAWSLVLKLLVGEEGTYKNETNKLDYGCATCTEIEYKIFSHNRDKMWGYGVHMWSTHVGLTSFVSLL